MKKWMAFLLALTLAAGCVACSGTPEGNETGPVERPGATQPAETPEPTAPASAGTLGDYDVEILEAHLAQDYEGKPVIVTAYRWTNNSDQTTSAMVALSEQAFQDGVELERAIVGNDDAYDPAAQMKDIRPGASLEVQCAFVLSSETAEVEFEVSNWLSFSNDVVSRTFDPAAL